MDRRVNFLINLAYVGGLIALAVLFFRYAFGKILPFLLGFLVAAAVERLVARLSQKGKRWLFSPLVVIPVWVLVFFLVWRLGTMLYGEAGQLLNWFRQTDFLSLAEQLPFLPKSGDAREWILARLRGFLPAVADLSQTVLVRLLEILMKLPDAFLFCFAMILSSLLFSLHFPDFEPFLLRQMSARIQSEYCDLKAFLSEKVLRLVKAYGILFLINYTELSAGFFLLNVRYPLIIAALVALFDLLPFIGTATVLIPWGIVSLILGDSARGAGLLVMAAIVSLVRELLQPKIVGRHIGLSPLGTLVSIYLGMKFLGFVGAFLFPLVFLFLKEWNSSGRILLWKNTPE